MVIFDIGIKILIFSAFIFFLVFALICRNWVDSHPEKATLIGIFVSGLHTFWFLFFGFLILIIVSLAFEVISKII